MIVYAIISLRLMFGKSTTPYIREMLEVKGKRGWGEVDILKIVTVVASTLLAIIALILNRNNFHLEFKIEIDNNKKEQ